MGELMADEILTTADIAERLRCSVRTAQRWVKRGWLATLPAPPGSPARIPLGALRARLDELTRRRCAEADG